MWTDACEQAFQRLKQLLCSAPILAYPDLGRKPTRLIIASVRYCRNLMIQDMRKLLHMRQKLLRLASRNTPQRRKKRLRLSLVQLTSARIPFRSPFQTNY